MILWIDTWPAWFFHFTIPIGCHWPLDPCGQQFNYTVDRLTNLISAPSEFFAHNNTQCQLIAIIENSSLHTLHYPDGEQLLQTSFSEMPMDFGWSFFLKNTCPTGPCKRFQSKNAVWQSAEKDREAKGWELDSTVEKDSDHNNVVLESLKAKRAAGSGNILNLKKDDEAKFSLVNYPFHGLNGGKKKSDAKRPRQVAIQL